LPFNLINLPLPSSCPGDVAKGCGGGADFVMLGGMLAGHDEGGGEVITKTYELNELLDEGDGWYAPVYDKKQFVQFYGMSSKAANDKHFGGLKEYRSSEGREVLVPYRRTAQTVFYHKLEHTIHLLHQGVHSIHMF
jgi:GMP reductase